MNTGSPATIRAPAAERLDKLPPLSRRGRQSHMDRDGIERALRRLEARAPVSDAGKAAVRALPYQYRTLEPAAYLVREGEPPTHCALLRSGFAYRHKVTGEGARQILSVHMSGEFLDPGQRLDVVIRSRRCNGSSTSIPTSAARCGSTLWSTPPSSANGWSMSGGAIRCRGSPTCSASSHCDSKRPDSRRRASTNCR